MGTLPRTSERSERHPGLGRGVSDTPLKGAKAATGRHIHGLHHLAGQSRTGNGAMGKTLLGLGTTNRHLEISVPGFENSIPGFEISKCRFVVPKPNRVFPIAPFPVRDCPARW